MPAVPNTRPRASPSRPAQNALATADGAWRTSCEAWKASGRSSTARRATHSSIAPSVVGRLSRVGRPDCLHERADELLRRPFHPTNDRKVREIRTRASGGREWRRLPLATANSRSRKWESLSCSSPTGSRCDTTNKRWLSRACCTDLVFSWRLAPLHDGRATQISVRVEVPDEKVERLANRQRDVIRASVQRLAQLAAEPD